MKTGTERGIKFYSGHVEGYGGLGYYWIRVIWNNRELEEIQCDTEWEIGKAEAKLEAKWLEQNWTDDEFEAAVKGAPQASPLCDHCGGNTLDGSISTVFKTFCQKCEPYIQGYKDAYRKKVDDEKRASDERQERDKQRRRLEIAEIRNGLHWRDNWFFRRLIDGSVRISEIESDEFATTIVVPANEWASIIASVSFAGEINGGWDAALRFHNESARQSSPPSASAQGWVSVKDRIPEDGEVCIVASARASSLAAFNDGWTFLWMQLMQPVEYWMPLPSPPTAQEPK